MLFNYIKLSLRKFSRQKFYSLLNILGLATGMATVILIMLFVADEMSFDNFHKNARDIYRIVEMQYYSGQPPFPVAVTPGPLAESLKAEFPEVELASRANVSWKAFQREDHRFDTYGLDVDEDFLRIFEFPLVRGDVKSALSEVNSVVISEKLSGKLFGKDSADAVGRMVAIGGKNQVMVTGIIKNVPENSHVTFDYLMPMAWRLKEVPTLRDDWGSNSLYTYVKLAPGTVQEEFDNKIRKYLGTKLERSVADLHLQPLTGIYLDEINYIADYMKKGNKQYVQIFSLVAVFILLIACINFMNLSTARAMKRAREVGLRKTIGAVRYQLVIQFLGESIMVALVALAIAFLMVDLLLPAFNSLTQKHLAVNWIDASGGILPLCLLATVITGVVAGSYPAIYLSSFQPARVLKGNLSHVAAGGSFRKFLVVLQFSISMVMISGTFVIYSQMKYIRNLDLGWSRENMLIIPNVNNFESLRSELDGKPGVAAVSATNQHPSYVMNSSAGFNWRGKPRDETILLHMQGVDYDYISTMKIQIIKGRSFSPDLPGDSVAIVINEQAAKVMGFDDPIGEQITVSDGSSYSIIGVAKDFHFRSIHDRIDPLLMFLTPQENSNVLVRLEGNVDEGIRSVENVWARLNNDKMLNYKFLDQDFDEQYRSEARTGKIFRYFSALAIIISCLGLFGLVAYTSEQRAKEFGIRKVFGASAPRLFYLASSEFLILVVFAFIISVPIAWFWMREWLDRFAYHVELSWFVFAGSGLISLIVALITVSYQAGRAVTANPSKTLRAD